MVPLVLINRPVSTGAVAFAEASRFNVAFGDAVLLPVTSPCSWKRGETVVFEDELNAEVVSLRLREPNPCVAVAVPPAGRPTAPFRVEAPLIVAVPATVRVAVGDVVPTPTSVPLSNKIELTIVLVPRTSQPDLHFLQWS